MIPLSVLDLVPIREGGTLAQALDEAAKLAATAEQAGYKRFWVAEHHATAGVAGGAASVVLAQTRCLARMRASVTSPSPFHCPPEPGQRKGRPVSLQIDA